MNVRWYLKYPLSGSVAKNLALLQNQCKSSQLGKLINLIAENKYTKVKIIVSNCGNIIFSPNHFSWYYFNIPQAVS